MSERIKKEIKAGLKGRYYKGHRIKKVRVAKSPYAPKGVEWRAEKKGKIISQPTLKALKFNINVRIKKGYTIFK